MAYTYSHFESLLFALVFCVLFCLLFTHLSLLVLSLVFPALSLTASPIVATMICRSLVLGVLFSLQYVESFSSTKKRPSVGEQIQKSQTVSDLLEVANDLWLPTDPDLPSHLRLQRVHHEKRQRWSAQLLAKMGTQIVSQEDWQDERLARTILGAAIPFEDDRPSKEGRYVKEALLGIHCILGNMSSAIFSSHVLDGIEQLIRRADALAMELPLPDAIEARWACRGILARLPASSLDDDTIVYLEARVERLPFDIIPKAINWDQIAPGEDPMDTLAENIPFSFDTITTRTGASVLERRGTAWIADEGIGALAYSGKLMSPQTISPAVRSAMDAVETAVLGNDDTFPRPFFDCALCNHYPDGDSACKFHTDPEHGSHWERLTCVVAAGQSRRFAFRPIPELTSWPQWDPVSLEVEGDPYTPSVITLFPGDVVKMSDSCNDDFHHAVYPEPLATADSGRISLVLKRAIQRGGGKRGHALAGQGRRARRKSRMGIDTKLQHQPKNDTKKRQRRR